MNDKIADAYDAYADLAAAMDDALWVKTGEGDEMRRVARIVRNYDKEKGKPFKVNHRFLFGTEEGISVLREMMENIHPLFPRTLAPPMTTAEKLNAFMREHKKAVFPRKGREDDSEEDG
jgi:hypothetical protein